MTSPLDELDRLLASAPIEIGEAKKAIGGGFRPLRTIVEEASEQMEWLVPGVLAPGVLTILSAAPKVGKSTLVAAMLDALARGAGFLGDELPQAGAVWLTEERSGTLRPKVARWPGLSDVHALMPHERDGRDWPTIVADAVGFALADGRRLLVVDTFAAWAELAGDDEYRPGFVLAAVAPLAEAAGAGLSVLLVAHDRKSGGDFGAGVRGSGALIGAVDVIAQLTRAGADEPTRRRLSIVSRFPESPDTLHLALGPDGYRLVESESHSRSDADAALVLAQLGELAFRVSELAELTGLSEQRVRDAAASLVASGLASRSTDAGRGHAALFTRAGSFVSPSPLGGDEKKANGDPPCGIAGHVAWQTQRGLVRCRTCSPPLAGAGEGDE